MREYEHEEEDPPAPCMSARVSNPILDLHENVRAKLDTGADLTVITEDLAQRLELVSSGSETFRGFDGQPTVRATHYVNIELDGYSFKMVKVTYGSQVLIGRDILNKLEIHLNGKAQTFEVTDP
jgi:predicted aspartyl protease